MIPIPGTKRRKYLEENVAAVEVKPSQDDLDTLEKLVQKYPNVGQRYIDGAMKLVNQ